MFYEENEINQLTQCPHCALKYQDPRIIDCGASLCLSCIDSLSTSVHANSGFHCPACKHHHPSRQPPNGYPKNISLAKMCQLNAYELSRGPLAHALKSSLAEIKSQLDQLRIESDLGVDKIKHVCQQLKDEAQLSSEELIERIKSLNMDLIQQIDEYERESRFGSSTPKTALG